MKRQKRYPEAMFIPLFVLPVLFFFTSFWGCSSPKVCTEAKNLFKSGEINGAIPLLDMCIAERAEDSEARLFLAICYNKSGRAMDAISHLNEILKNDQTNEPALYELAKSHILLGETHHALLVRNRIAENDGDNFYSLLIDARIALTRKDYPNAAEKSRAASQKNKNDLESRLILAQSLFYSGQIDSAVEVLDNAKRVDPDDPGPYLAKTQLFMQQNLPDKAEQELIQFTNNLPASSFAQKQLATFYLKQNKLPDAQSNFEKALEINPKDTSARFSLADVFMRSQQRDKAKEQLEQILTIDKTNSNALMQLIEILMLQNKYDDAEKLVNQLEILEPENINVSMIKSRLLFAQGKKDETRTALLEGLKKNPTQPFALYWLAQMFNQLGDAQKAQELIEKAAEMAKKNKSASTDQTTEQAFEPLKPTPTETANQKRETQKNSISNLGYVD